MLLIKNIHIYAPEDLGRGNLWIEGERIVRVDVPAPEEDITEKLSEICGLPELTVIDGTGKIAIPGMIDAHVHILGGGGEGGYRTRTPEIVLTDITKGGVTTVVGCLGTDGTTRTMSNLLAKARGLEEEGISTYIYTGSYQVPVRTLTGHVMDDVILIDKVVGCGEIAISDHRSSQPTAEEFERIVADTRVGGILSGKAGLVNIHMGDGPRQIEYLRQVVEKTEIPPQNMLPTHMNRKKSLFEDGVDYAKNLGGYMDLTTSFDADHMEEDELRACTGLRMALEQGVPSSHITFSSDGQGSLPMFDEHGNFAGLGVGKVTSLFEEVRAAVREEGVSLTDALRTVTENPAALLKLERKGGLKPGKDGDVVLLEEKTLEIDTVIAKGRLMIQDRKVLVKGTFEN